MRGRQISNLTWQGKIGICAFTMIFILIGLAIMKAGIGNILSAKSSVNWPQAEGKIIKSEVESNTDSDGTTWHAQVAYSFLVNGTEMKGNKVAFGDYGSSNISHAQMIVNKYPLGNRVKVYYNPKDPYICLLEPGLQNQSYFLLLFGFAFFAMGSFFFIVILKVPLRRS